MAGLARFVVLVPLIFSIAAAVLAALALTAGHEKGFMEEYAIARLNTSMLGHNMIDLSDDDDSSKDNGKGNVDDDDDDDSWFGGDDDDDDDDDDDGFFRRDVIKNRISSRDDSKDDDDDSWWDDLGDDIQHTWDDVKGDIEKELNNITGSLADELAETLGISQWYSIHVMSACYGDFKPNATAATGWNITACNETAPNSFLNLTELINGQLELGPFDLNLTDFGWPDAIQDAIDTINDCILGLFILYIIGVVCAGLAVFTALLSFFLPDKRSLSLLNLGISGIAALALLIGSVMVTVMITSGVDSINDVGDDIGVHVVKGNGFLGLTWASAALMMVATGVWCVQFFLAWRQKRKERSVRRSKEHM